MISRWTKTTILAVLLVFGWTTVAVAQNKQKQPLLETGDQAQKEIAQGLFIKPNVGLLTFVFGDGALVYRPGLMMDIHIGYDVSKTLSVYGLLAGTVMGNTTCFKNPKGSNCSAEVRTKFRGQPSVPRQGVFLNAGAGARFQFLNLDERILFHGIGEAMLQVIVPDNASELDTKKLDSTRQNMAIGGGVGLGIGIEYFPHLKHFSVTADARAYFFLTKFMPGGAGGGLAGMLGLGLYASVGMKYTF